MSKLFAVICSHFIAYYAFLNYLDDPIKLFSNLYLIKFLYISTKSFFWCIFLLNDIQISSISTKINIQKKRQNKYFEKILLIHFHYSLINTLFKIKKYEGHDLSMQYATRIFIFGRFKNLNREFPVQKS